MSGLIHIISSFRDFYDIGIRDSICSEFGEGYGIENSYFPSIISSESIVNRIASKSGNYKGVLWVPDYSMGVEFNFAKALRDRIYDGKIAVLNCQDKYFCCDNLSDVEVFVMNNDSDVYLKVARFLKEE